MTNQPNFPQAQPAESFGKTPEIGVEKAIAPETGGPKGLDPTRYGDWEINGKCVDF